MPTPGDPGDSDLIELTIELAVEFGQTKTVHRVKRRGTLKFKNGSKNKSLAIKSPAPVAPFVVPGYPGPVSEFTVPRNSSMNVTISEAYDIGASFTYTAQIEDSLPEDPIVIIDRH